MTKRLFKACTDKNGEILQLNRQIGVLKYEMEGMVKLPLDADGVPIHVGDVLDPPADCDDYTPLLVMRLTYDGYEDEWFFDGDVGGFCGMVGEHMDVAGWTHHHAPNVEDVLREFALACEDAGNAGPEVERIAAEFSKRLRLVGDE